MGAAGSPAELTAQGVVEVVVPAPGAAPAFYPGLGFTAEREPPTFATLRWESTLLRIVVGDVEAVCARVSELPLPVGTPVSEGPYGLHAFTVRDPAGFETRLAQVIAESGPVPGAAST